MRRRNSVDNPTPSVGRPALAGLVLLFTAAWQAQGNGLGDRNLADASLEELMNIEVRSVGRKSQKLTSVASAVYLITREDLRRSGAASVPEALRMVPGLQVARIDASKWAISARGFNRRFANKMLVLVDGRTIYNNMYSGVYWDQNDVPLENIERIEVIRGPGATMWGANAVNGVINIITRSSSDTQGAMVSTGAGTEDRGSAFVQYGGAVNDRLHYRVFGKANNWNHLSSPGGVGSSGDDWRQRRGGGRMDWLVSQRDNLTIHGDGYTGSASQSSFANFPRQTSGPTLREQVAFDGSYLLTRWERSHSEDSTTALQVYANQENRREPLGDARLQTLDLDLEHRYHRSARHDVVFGGGFRRLKDRIRSVTRVFDPESRTDHLASGFLQDDVCVLPERLILTVGTKLLHNSYSGFEVQPSVRVLYAASPEEQFWSAVSRAVRTPSRRDQDLRIRFDLPPQATPLPVVGQFGGDPDFGSEKVIAYEAGYRNLFHRRVAVDLASFFNRYSSLESVGAGQLFLEPGPVPHMVLPIRVGNKNHGHTYGVDLTSTWSLNSRWRVYGNYSWLRVNISNTGNETPFLSQGGISSSPVAILFSEVTGSGRDPQHTVQVRTSIDVTPGFGVDAAVYRVSKLQGVNIPGYARADVHVNWRLRGGLMLSAGFRNMLDPSHREMLSEGSISGSEMRRGPYVKLTWTSRSAQDEEQSAPDRRPAGHE